MLLVVSLLGTRLAWQLSVSELGWSPHLVQWVKVASELAGVEYRSPGDEDPTVQAQFWLNEAKEVGKESDDPMIAMGAAWMLDSPQLSFMRRHVRVNKDLNSPGTPTGVRMKSGGELDLKTIAEMTGQFEQLCRNECLNEIDRAVRLDETNVELHRARALLLFKAISMSSELQHRRDDWITVLGECAEADPENALYDYLAAVHLWKSSATYDVQEDGFVLKVEDRQRFEQGQARLAAGLKKPRLDFGREGFAATFRFLEATSMRRRDFLYAAASRNIDNRIRQLLIYIMRWHGVQCDVDKRAGKFDDAILTARRGLAISEQIIQVESYPSVAAPRMWLRQWGYAILKDIQNEQPHLFNTDETAKITIGYADGQREQKIFEEACRRMTTHDAEFVSAVAPGTTVSASAELRTTVLMAIVQELIILCVVMIPVSSFGKVVFSRSNETVESNSGWLSQSFAWILSICISFVWRGVLSVETVPANAWSGSAWDLSLLQWLARSGPLVSAVIAALILVFWQVIGCRWSSEGGQERSLRSLGSSIVLQSCMSISSSCVCVSLISLMLYLGTTPTVADAMDSQYQQYRSRMVDPEQAWKELEDHVAEVRNDKETMDRLITEIDERNRRLAE